MTCSGVCLHRFIRVPSSPIITGTRNSHKSRTELRGSGHRSRLAPFVRLAQTIKKHREGILAAVRLGITQGRTEALNNKVRLITRRAYGFHSAKAALALVLLTCRPITLTLPHELHLHP